jgi:Tfp pilus assembly protein PilN
MIDVNLLGPARPASAAGRVRRKRPAWIGLAWVAAAALGCGIAWWSVRADVARVDRELATLEGQAVQLRAAARDAEQVLARKTALLEQAASVNRERETRFAPVRALAAVGRSLPADVWLISLHQRGTRIEIDGRALSLEAITDFAARIRHAGVVTTPVEVLSTSSENRDGPSVVRFSLRSD